MAYNKKKYLENREWFRLFMEGRVCELCGSKVDLHWHHRDATGSISRVGSLMTTNPERIMAEVDQCRLLCKPCHVLEHRRFGKKPRIDRALSDERVAEIIEMDQEALRQGTWLTQQELASRFGVSQSVISRVLGGTYTRPNQGTDRGSRH